MAGWLTDNYYFGFMLPEISCLCWYSKKAVVLWDSDTPIKIKPANLGMYALYHF